MTPKANLTADDDERIVAGARVRFRPPRQKQAWDAGLAGKEGIVIGERWGKDGQQIRVQTEDGRTWLTSLSRLELIEEPHESGNS
jgi:hypothetical protein